MKFCRVLQVWKEVGGTGPWIRASEREKGMGRNKERKRGDWRGGGVIEGDIDGEGDD